MCQGGGKPPREREREEKRESACADGREKTRLSKLGCQTRKDERRCIKRGRAREVYQQEAGHERKSINKRQAKREPCLKASIRRGKGNRKRSKGFVSRISGLRSLRRWMAVSISPACTCTLPPHTHAHAPPPTHKPRRI